jgi:hypothetical protein
MAETLECLTVCRADCLYGAAAANKECIGVGSHQVLRWTDPVSVLTCG